MWCLYYVRAFTQQILPDIEHNIFWRCGKKCWIQNLEHRITWYTECVCVWGCARNCLCWFQCDKYIESELRKITWKFVTNNGLCYMVSTQLEFHTASSSFVGTFGIMSFVQSYAFFFHAAHFPLLMPLLFEQTSNISCSINSTCAHSCSCVHEKKTRIPREREKMEL